MCGGKRTIHDFKSSMGFLCGRKASELLPEQKKGAANMINLIEEKINEKELEWCKTYTLTISMNLSHWSTSWKSERQSRSWQDAPCQSNNQGNRDRQMGTPSNSFREWQEERPVKLQIEKINT